MSRGPDAATMFARALDRQARRAGCPIELVGSDWSRWASATFVGARHQMTIAAMPCPALERWLIDLPEADFELSGHLVADLAITATRRAAARVEIDLEALTVEAR